MRHVFVPLAAAMVLMAIPAIAGAAESAQPEIQREPASPQPVGQVHTLRNIPEACVRLEGQFTGDAATPYRFRAVKRDPCAQRAAYIERSGLKQPPKAAAGWILNDRIRVPRADAPACVAVLEVWRRAGDVAPPKLDPQGRSRIFLDKPQQPTSAPLFTAMLAIDAKSCK